MSKLSKKNTVVLTILDGWGHSEQPNSNAIAMAKTPTMDKLLKNYPNTLLECCGKSVGLPEGQMGNSEVGHMTIGAGKVFLQDLSRIDQAIEDKSFYNNSVLLNSLKHIYLTNSALHIMGLFSNGGIHSHENHFYALIDTAAKIGIQKIYIHCFTDGRDTPPTSAKMFITKLENYLTKLGCGKIASITGRFYAMDRDNNLDRTNDAFELITKAKSEHNAKSATEALDINYENGITDEFIKPTNIASQPISENDAIIFMNFRADRARQLSRLIIDNKNNLKLYSFLTLTEYDKTIHSEVLFKPEEHDLILAKILEQNNLKQLRIAETEKYAHVTYFFNAGREEPYKLEDRILIPSPNVKTYDLKPEMSANKITEELIKNIQKREYDLIVVNYANADMVGHTGNLNAAIDAVEEIDKSLNLILAELEKINGEAIITADHGNAEIMYCEKTKQKFTQHTMSKVPFIYIGNRAKLKNKSNPSLADIAPTILNLLNIAIPHQMQGKSLLKL